MNQPTDVAAVITAFKSLVKNKRPSIKSGVKARKKSPPETHNEIRIKGIKSQTAEPLRRSGPETEEKGHLEHTLHTAIVKNPVLLHTPDLYAGGLYLDSIINKLGLPFYRFNDFGYITVQGNTIKITLIEIEQAAKPVFNNYFTNRRDFQGETEKAIDQVRRWQKMLKSESRKKTVLANLKPLFEDYPIEIFDQNDDPLPSIRIEFGYVLVVGNEMPTLQQHHDLIDDLYINENILFMTYPMMIEMVERAPHHKNMLKIGAPGIDIVTLNRPESLGLDPRQPTRGANDPFGIKLAGLGHPHFSPEEHVMNPGRTKQAFYRSKGRCERPGCQNKIVHEFWITATFIPIYNAYGKNSAGHKIMQYNNSALCCPMHTRLEFNDGVRIALGDHHPLTHAMQKRGAYRHTLDIASTRFIKSRIENLPDALVAALQIDPQRESQLAEQIKSCAFALHSLPKWPRITLEKIVKDYYRSRYSNHVDRSKHALKTYPQYAFLLRAGLIRVNPMADAGKEIEPTIYSRELIERIDNLFGDRAMHTYPSLFYSSPSGITKELKRTREKAVT